MMSQYEFDDATFKGEPLFVWGAWAIVNLKKHVS